jgi:hypothetical protein
VQSTELNRRCASLLLQISCTSIDELLNDLKIFDVAEVFKDEVWLEGALKDWKKWSKKSVYAKNRYQYIDIINYLNKELTNVRGKNNTRSSRTLGLSLGRYKIKNRHAGDADNLNADPKRKDMGVAQKRVFSIGRKNKPGQE